MGVRVVVSGSAESRRAAVLGALGSVAPSAPALVVGASLSAARDLLFEAVRGCGAAFGWQAASLELIARRLAIPRLAERDRVPVAGATLPAIVARVLGELRAAGRLGRYEPVGDAPGLPAALAATIAELRMTSVAPASVAPIDPDLGAVYDRTCRELVRIGLADRAGLYREAIEVARSPRSPWRGAAIALVDVELGSELEAELIAALAESAPAAIATAVRGDDRSIALLEHSLGVEATSLDGAPARSLERAQAGLFAAAAEPCPADGSIQVFSAPSESRECVELARRVLELVDGGARFDQIAVLLRAPGIHRPHLVEAFARARIPAFFSTGTTRPDPSGRALLTLLDCADEGLSARAFAEYLSLSVLPGEPEAIRAPRRWERFIVDAAVIGGLERWRRRLRGRANELRLAMAAAAPNDEARAARLAADLEILEALEAYALPILEHLDGLPERATWSVWLDQLRSLAAVAVAQPETVLSVLTELEPMGPVGPVSLLEVRAVLGARLGDLVVSPSGGPAGKVFVGTVESARGRAFDVVFVPGLAESVFPPKLLEDPILVDSARAEIAAALPVTGDRVRAERALLQIAVGAARRQLLISYARLDGEQARPRVPSFYGLEILRAAEGELPGFKAYARRAHVAGGARMGWPAPAAAAAAIDETEYDLAVLEGLLYGEASASRGAARYLLETNAHLARALRFRARRWMLPRWTSADGLVDLEPAALEHLQAHALAARAYSATALQRYGACPYRFYLHSMIGLSPREAPGPIEDLGPLERGSLIHEIQFRFLREVHDSGVNLGDARELLDAIAGEVARHYRETLAPAIERVWTESIDRVRRDLGGWLERVAASEWTPVHFELAFGLRSAEQRDRASRAEPVELDSGLKIRGAIDLVERSGSSWRATDNKTGRKPFKPRYLVIGGGQVLQPVLYAMALEKIVPGAEVAGGRLFYCTDRGEYAEEMVSLDDAARDAVALIARSLGDAIARGFLPAAPAKRACAFCDYRPICGPYEELRTGRKERGGIESLLEIRRQP